MIKPENEILKITLSKKQVKWLRDNAKKFHMTVSKFVKWLIDKNTANLARRAMTQEELDEFIRIVRTPWIKFNDDDDEY